MGPGIPSMDKVPKVSAEVAADDNELDSVGTEDMDWDRKCPWPTSLANVTDLFRERP